MKDGQIYINDRLLEEAYLAEGQSTQVPTQCSPVVEKPYLAEPVMIPEDSYLALGDSRNESYDGRCWGVVPRDYIIGKATKIFWPPQRSGSIY